MSRHTSNRSANDGADIRHDGNLGRILGREALGPLEVGRVQVLRAVRQEVESCESALLFPPSPSLLPWPHYSASSTRERLWQAVDIPVIMQIAQIHLTQFVFNMAPISFKKTLLPFSCDGFARASSLASKNWRDSGKRARTPAAAREKPAPIKKRERHWHVSSSNLEYSCYKRHAVSRSPAS